MKILLLADINSVHTQKWAVALHEKGLEIAVFSINRLAIEHPGLRGVTKFYPGNSHGNISDAGLLVKLRYLSAITSLKASIKKFGPDIVHAHYASSYGILGSLCGFHPFILSVWGSDIFEFPHTSILARLLIRYNLRKADRILSTSNALAEETRKYTSKKIEITPFGIDLEKFKPFPVEPLFSQETIVIGTVKALEAIYGIEYLIEAFGILVHKYPLEKLRLLIVGGGPQELFLKEKAAALGLKDSIVFTGRIPHQQVPEYLNMIDIFAALSIIESFGVAVVEAGACELPVVVTNTGGLKEVVQDHVTGLLVPPKDVEKTASAFEMLLLDPALRKTMGKQGRERISRLYNWDDNVDGMIRIYQQFR